ncbi:MAG: Asp-tRNA(Asn)/Glu-tRNA(Gln) amidotransferase subunit GatB [Patescibacteria group bacterium]
MSSFRPTIGLEVHAELATETKMFCRCLNDPEESRPNVNVCPVCLAHPGTLPAANREAIHKVLQVGSALGSTLADYTEFDRKSYFYPDIPKGYQISQYEYPLVQGGTLAGIPITRVHLEEDTARSSHEGAESTSEVDFNRAGVPLMELVTDPAIHDSVTAGRFARELQLLLRTLGASHANLEKGEMRIEANISVSTDENFGTKVEVKNLNSFRSVERAIEFEIARQTKLIEEGGSVEQETRGWDETKQETFRQRTKEGSADYRYFPEPDLPKIVRSEIPQWSDAALAASLPELPTARATRYASLGVKESDAELIRADARDAAYFDTVLAGIGAERELVTLASNYFVSDLKGLAAKSEDAENIFGKVTSEAFVELVRMAHAGDLSSRGAKDVLVILYTEGGSARSVAEAHGLLQVSDTEALRAAVEGVISANPEAVAQLKAGKEASLQFLLGQSMKAMKGAGNPAILRELIVEALRQ